jgi:hypothetical protein
METWKYDLPLIMHHSGLFRKYASQPKTRANESMFPQFEWVRSDYATTNGVASNYLLSFFQRFKAFRQNTRVVDLPEKLFRVTSISDRLRIRSVAQL